MREFGRILQEASQDASSPAQIRQRIGALAIDADTVPGPVRRAVIEARLAGSEWPAWPLLIAAVDAVSGGLRAFDRESHTDLINVVAASCAVPMVWPPVEIQGHVYIDGGIRSAANADLAAGAEQILILVPAAPVSTLGETIPQEQLAALGAARTHAVYADATSVEVMGLNPLDPSTRIPAAHAGREQGRRQAADLDAFWH